MGRGERTCLMNTIGTCLRNQAPYSVARFCCGGGGGGGSVISEGVWAAFRGVVGGTPSAIINEPSPSWTRLQSRKHILESTKNSNGPAPEDKDLENTELSFQNLSVSSHTGLLVKATHPQGLLQ